MSESGQVPVLNRLIGVRSDGAGRRRQWITGIVGVTALGGYTAMRMRKKKDRDSTAEQPRTELTAAVTVRKPLAEVFGAWEQVENLPVFMEHVESVQTTVNGRSRWRAKGPAGHSVEWEAEVVAKTPNELIRWRSVEGSEVDNSGELRFTPAPGGRGTEVHLRMRYEAPAGKLGDVLARLLGDDPAQQVKDDLRRFKQVLETGEVVRSDSTPEGTGARGFFRQRPARPPAWPEPVAEGRHS